jgi:phospholipase C
VFDEGVREIHEIIDIRKLRLIAPIGWCDLRRQLISTPLTHLLSDGGVAFRRDGEWHDVSRWSIATIIAWFWMSVLGCCLTTLSFLRRSSWCRRNPRSGISDKVLASSIDKCRIGYAPEQAEFDCADEGGWLMAVPITHVVVLMMENHSFDRVFGWMKTQHPGIEAIDPDNPGTNPDYPDRDVTVFQEPTQHREIGNDPGHDLDNVLRQIANGNQGFVSDFVQKYPQAGLAERKEVMGYYPYGYLPALHFLAYNFVVCDHWFASLPGPTWPNRFFAHSGTSLGHFDMPEGVFNPALHLYDQRTLYDELDGAGVDWRIYHADFPQSLLLTHQLDKLDHYRKFDQWAADVRAGDLPPYVFIEPFYFGTEENDQHPPQDIMRGDLLVAEVFNALHANQAVFERTLLVVLYDEHGGFYDHVTPPPTVAPDTNTQRYAFNQLGVRVPAVLVSPWFDRGFNSTVFDHTSLLKSASQLWPGVNPLCPASITLSGLRIIVAGHRIVVDRERCASLGKKNPRRFTSAPGHPEHSGGATPDWAIELVPAPRG